MPHLFYYSTPNVDLYCWNILPTYWLIFWRRRLKFCVKLRQQLDTPHIIFKNLSDMFWLYSFQKLLLMTHQFHQQKSEPCRACFLVWYLFTPKLKSYLQSICSQQLKNRSISKFFSELQDCWHCSKKSASNFLPLQQFFNHLWLKTFI